MRSSARTSRFPAERSSPALPDCVAHAGPSHQRYRLQSHHPLAEERLGRHCSATSPELSDTVEEPNSIARVDGQNSVALSIRKQTGTNTVAVVHAMLARLETIKETLPTDINIAIRQNQATFIERSIDDIQHHLIYGSLLASLVVFFFLRNIRSTIIAALAIPVSLIGTFIVMKVFGQTLNNMTLLALSLATGIVIDDAIVVLENIFRYVEEKGVSATAGRLRSDCRNRSGRPRNHAVAGRDFPSRGFHHRPDRTVPAGIRHRFGDGDPDFDVCVVHADAGTLRDLVAASGRGRQGHTVQEAGAFTQGSIASTPTCWSGVFSHRFVMLTHCNGGELVCGAAASANRNGTRA